MNFEICTEYKFIADETVMSDVAWQLWQDLYSIRRNEVFLGILHLRHGEFTPMI